jgi:sugar lactone lactonase YvrE
MIRRRIRRITVALGMIGAALLIAGAYFRKSEVHGPAWIPRIPGRDTMKPTVFGWAGISEILAGGPSGFADGKSRDARFADPFGIALDGDGNVYISDAGDNNRIRKIAADGTVTTIAGAREGFADGPSTSAAFHTPSGIAFDAAGNLYVADTGNNAIRKITPQGIVTTAAGTGKAGYRDGAAGEAQFNGPIGVAVDKQGNVYVADTYNDRIRVITPEGLVKTLAGGDRPGFQDGAGLAARFDTPCGIAVNNNGELLIADTKNNAIRKLTRDGSVTTLARTPPEDHEALLRRPMNIMPTHDGFLYVTEVAQGRILQMSPAGEWRAVQDGAARGSDTAAHFSRPSGIAMDKRGVVYVADAAAYTIFKLAQRATAAEAPALVRAAVATELPSTPGIPRKAAQTPWPLKPQNGWHEVVGTMGEVRGNYRGESRDHFHGGVDVQAALGTPVLAVIDEKVGSPISTWGYGELNEGLSVGTMNYIHMRVGRTEKDAPLDPEKFALLTDEANRMVRVRVKRGTRFATGEVLGTVNRMYHVHLDFAPDGSGSNPLALGFPGFRDRIPPHIDGIRLFDSSGKQLAKTRHGHVLVSRENATALSIVVDAYDQVDGNQSRRRLGLYKLGYQILGAGGTPVRGYESPIVNLEFNRLPVDREAVKIAYADASGDIAHGNGQTRFLYVVTNTVRDGIARTGSWRAADLPPGDYVLRILATDYAGNEAKAGRDLAITIE